MRSNPHSTAATAELTGTGETCCLYWTRFHKGTIMRASLNGTGLTTLVTGQDRALGVAVSP